MKSLTEYLVFKTKQKKEFVNITKDIERLVQKSGIKDGLCLVNAMHITASVFINDNESGLHRNPSVLLGCQMIVAKKYDPKPNQK